MARSLRVTYEGAWYHVMNRGARCRVIFPTDDLRNTFLDLLGDITTIFGVEIHAYCLMDTHYHLLVHTPRGNLSGAMRHLNGVYTQRFNRLNGTDGSLFRGRFKAILLDADAYLAQLSRYIHLNPILAKVRRKPLDARWSSYAAYLGTVQPPGWLHCSQTLGSFGALDAANRYQAFVESGLDAETQAFYDRQRLDPIFGGEDFRRRIAQSLEETSYGPEIPDAKRIAPDPTLEKIMQVTAGQFGVRPEELCRDGRGAGNLPRMVAMSLLDRPWVIGHSGEGIRPHAASAT